MGYRIPAWPDWPMEWDGIGWDTKIQPDPSRAELEDKTLKTDCDEMKTLCAAADH